MRSERPEVVLANGDQAWGLLLTRLVDDLVDPIEVGFVAVHLDFGRLSRTFPSRCFPQEVDDEMELLVGRLVMIVDRDRPSRIDIRPIRR